MVVYTSREAGPGKRGFLGVLREPECLCGVGEPWCPGHAQLLVLQAWGVRDHQTAALLCGAGIGEKCWSPTES